MPTTIEPIRQPLSRFDLAMVVIGALATLSCIGWLAVFTLEAIAAMGGAL